MSEATETGGLHRPIDPDSALGRSVLGFVADRRRASRVGRTADRSELDAQLAGALIRPGLGWEAAWDLFTSTVAANTFDLDGPRFLAFVPMAPATAAFWMDVVVSAASFSAESSLEAAGAVAAENQALDLLRTLAGFPAAAGGAFCSGGSIGNLSALAVARDQGGGRRACLVGDTAHASVMTACHLLGLDVATAPTGPDGVLSVDTARRVIEQRGDGGEIAVVVASAGSTNAGVIDDLAGLVDLAHSLGAWCHVDAAYGGAALLVDECRPLFAGVEGADSLIVDPHKWLFSTGGSCALLYREPRLAVATHRQTAPYIDVLHGADEASAWNPSDYAFQLTRRACGLPFWFTLAVHGLDAVAAAVRRTLALARHAADGIAASPDAELILEPRLGVVLFRRRGWWEPQWRAWAQRLADEQIAFVAPTTWRGETVGRQVVMNPLTTEAILDEVIATLADEPSSRNAPENPEEDRR